jgi:hypothetical protein
VQHCRDYRSKRRREAGDGPGGTADMVQLAKSHGAKVCIKDTKELFGLGG